MIAPHCGTLFVQAGLIPFYPMKLRINCPPPHLKKEIPFFPFISPLPSSPVLSFTNETTLYA